jgi:hypothetical protein
MSPGAAAFFDWSPARHQAPQAGSQAGPAAAWLAAAAS